MSKRETATERRAREAAEMRAAVEVWQSRRPFRLLEALARANGLLDVESRVFYRDGSMHYEFDCGNYERADGLVIELNSWTMDMIDKMLDDVEERLVKQRRMENLRREVLSKLTDEEREALGISHD
jgi:hypothetical protein